jgi:hypothetical protein
MRVGEQFLEGLAGLIETGLGHRSHFLWYLERALTFVTHVPLLSLELRSDPQPGLKKTGLRSQDIDKSMRPCDA